MRLFFLCHFNLEDILFVYYAQGAAKHEVSGVFLKHVIVVFSRFMRSNMNSSLLVQAVEIFTA